MIVFEEIIKVGAVYVFKMKFFMKIRHIIWELIESGIFVKRRWFWFELITDESLIVVWIFSAFLNITLNLLFGLDKMIISIKGDIGDNMIVFFASDRRIHIIIVFMEQVLVALIKIELLLYTLKWMNSPQSTLFFCFISLFR